MTLEQDLLRLKHCVSLHHEEDLFRLKHCVSLHHEEDLFRSKHVSLINSGSRRRPIHLKQYSFIINIARILVTPTYYVLGSKVAIEAFTKYVADTCLVLFPDL